jgi:formamidopyrimidine-DNA glycosylase
MPELPDLLYLQKYLRKEISNSTITSVIVKQPVVIRVAVNQSFEQALPGMRITSIETNGPFILFELTGALDLVINLMVAGKLQLQHAREKSLGYLCFSLKLNDGRALNLCDEQQMAKAYLVHHGEFGSIPKYSDQGINIFSSEFSLEQFKTIAAGHTRKQVRVFINDHSILSAIGNAYADEILFDAKIHPKTFVVKLSPKELEVLYSSIRSVIEWGIQKVEEAQQPIHIKIRDHMKVRGRRGEPCQRCGTTIRREGVRGHDVFFCSHCQRASRKLFLDWTTT